MNKVAVGRSNTYQWATLFINIIIPQEEVITALCVHRFHEIKQVRKLVLHANSVWRISLMITAITLGDCLVNHTSD